MIERIEINGFKSLREFEIEMGAVNVFIGANGSGKSNILEAIGVLSAAASGRIDDEALMRRGVRPGLPSLYKSSFKGDRTPASIALSACTPEASYSVSLLNPMNDPKPAWEYTTESLTSNGGTVFSRGLRDKETYDPLLGLAALKAVELAQQDPAGSLLSTLQEYAIYTPYTPILRGIAADPQPRDPVGLSGARLASAIYDLQKTAEKDERIAAALDDVLGCMDWVEAMDTTLAGHELLSPSVNRSKRLLRFKDRYMVKERNMLTAYDASEGALYVLFAAALTLSLSSPSFLAVDNVDQALNPRLVRELSRLLCEWVLEGERQQIIVTAHNPAAVDGLDLEDERVRLFAVDRNNQGQTRVHRVRMTAELAEMAKKNDWPLSRLWMMGHIGGVPNV
jgi:predicted ATPase